VAHFFYYFYQTIKMSKTGPIVIIDDDEDDSEFVKQSISELGLKNKVISFDNCDDAFSYLLTTTDQPFIIFSDVNLPRKNGIDFKKQIDNDKKLRKKSIPFVFYSTATDPKTVDTVYTELTVQGYFQKPNSTREINELIKAITDYWKICKHPNSV
jgi:two-component SAPR family response regulator